ncbi:MAG: hypothetical protein MUD12_06795 [Spirochaetes bacterium]|jgi:hypothetical protein|nr:hypothetical protein [Spirochaetota bacterium]
MRKITVILFAGFVLFTAIDCMAAPGFGAYVNGGGGMNFQKYGIHNIGGGLLFDTNVSGDRLFNYRLNIGVDRWHEEFMISEYKFFEKPVNTKSIDYPRLHINNSFGFGLIKEKDYRLWLGPQIGFGFGFSKRFRLFTGSIGPVLGFNYNLSDRVTFGIEGSIMTSIEDKIYKKYAPYEIGAPPSIVWKLAYLGFPIQWYLHQHRVNKSMIDGSIIGNISLSIIYRIGE